MAHPLSHLTHPRLPPLRSEAEDFVRALQDGLRLSKRIYFGNDRSVIPHRPVSDMERSPESLFPTSPMVYAVVPDPRVVDNPDVPSYQPHVHGRCDPPALIPLQMNRISVQADCYLDTAFVTVTGSWRVHCVSATKHSDCRIAIPMGEQGSILGVEVDAPGKSYCTQFIGMDYKNEPEKLAGSEEGGYLKPHIFTLTIPQVLGGSNISVKARWTQKLLYNDDQISLIIPFSFPDYVIPVGKIMTKVEKIQLNVYPDPGSDIKCEKLSHPVKELRRQGVMVCFLHEAQVIAWSNRDVTFTYSVSNEHSGGLLLQSPSPQDADQRNMFCFYLSPGTGENRKFFRKQIVYIVDTSGSMDGKPIEETRNALVAAISKLDTEDSFNVVAFNDETRLFSSSLEFATEEVIDKATQWMSANFVAHGDTNISLPLSQAIGMLSNSHSGTSIPMIFLITDGSVGDEKNICEFVQNHVSSQRWEICPRLCTFGIGSFCNHYFLEMLAMIGRGHHYASYDAELIEVRLEAFFSRAASTILANIELDGLDADEVEVYPCEIPDLSAKSALIVSGRYKGSFPENVKAKGILTDGTNVSIDLVVQEANDIPLEQVLAKQQIERYTAQAWFSGSKELEEKVTRISGRFSLVSEYTHMIMLEFDIDEKAKKNEAQAAKKEEVHCEYPHLQKEEKKETAVEEKNETEVEEMKETEVEEVEEEQEAEEHKKEKEKETEMKKKKKPKSSNCSKMKVFPNLGVGFGDIDATVENTPPGSEIRKLPEAAEKFVMAASSCCEILCDCWCCPCCISVCSRMNDQCAFALTQLCGALTCLGCYTCCELCFNSNDS